MGISAIPPMRVSSLQLIFLAAGLSAVALAAPRNTIPDESFSEDMSLVQSSATAVDELSKSFAQLRADVTARKTKGLAKTIKRLVAMITDTIEPDIRDTIRDEALTVRKAQKYFNTVVGEWQVASVNYDKAKKQYEATHAKKEEICCEKAQAEVNDIVYTPSSYSCDFTDDAKADRCVSDAQSSITALTQAHFTKGRNNYDGLVSQCAGLKTSTSTTLATMTRKDNKCDRVSTKAKIQKQSIDLEKKTLLSRFAELNTNFDTTWKQVTASYTKAQGIVRTNTDERKGEWGSVMEIKCMLNAYKEEGTFTESAEGTCKSKKVTSSEHLKIDTTVKHAAKQEQAKLTFITMLSYSSFQHVCTIDAVISEPVCVIPSAKPLPKCMNHDEGDEDEKIADSK